MPSYWITFDCFGTLVDWNTGFANILRPMFGDNTEKVISAYHHYERLIAPTRPHQLYKNVVIASLLCAAAQCNLKITRRDAKRIIEQWHTMPLFADTEPLLDNLRSMGFKLAVLTNCDDDLFTNTHRTFSERFDLVVTAERVGDYKPSSAHFRHFWKRTFVDRSNWIHVAASWYHDIAPAKEFGIQRIWLDREHTGEDATIATAHVHSGKDAFLAIQQLQDSGNRHNAAMLAACGLFL